MAFYIGKQATSPGPSHEIDLLTAQSWRNGVGFEIIFLEGNWYTALNSKNKSDGRHLDIRVTLYLDVD